MDDILETNIGRDAKRERFDCFTSDGGAENDTSTGLIPIFKSWNH